MIQILSKDSLRVSKTFKKVELLVVQKSVSLLDPEKGCFRKVYFLKVGFDTAKNEPSEVS